MNFFNIYEEKIIWTVFFYWRELWHLFRCHSTFFWAIRRVSETFSRCQSTFFWEIRRVSETFSRCHSTFFRYTDTKNDSLHPVKKSHLFRGHVDPLFRCPRSKNGIKWEPDTHKWVSRHLPIRSRVSFDSPDSSNDLENTSFKGVMTPFHGCQVLIWSHFLAEKTSWTPKKGLKWPLKVMGVMIPEKMRFFDRVGSHYCYQCMIRRVSWHPSIRCLVSIDSLTPRMTLKMLQ